MQKRNSRVQLVGLILVAKRLSPSAECVTGLIATNAWTKITFVWFVERRAKLLGEWNLFLGFGVHFGHLGRFEKITKNMMAGSHTRLHSLMLASSHSAYLCVLKAAKEIGADLIVMATHGMKASFPFGSVTERVVRHSPVAVLTISPLMQRI
jgi:hypothetical protein